MNNDAKKKVTVAADHIECCVRCGAQSSGEQSDGRPASVLSPAAATAALSASLWQQY